MKRYVVYFYEAEKMREMSICRCGDDDEAIRCAERVLNVNEILTAAFIYESIGLGQLAVVANVFDHELTIMQDGSFGGENVH